MFYTEFFIHTVASDVWVIITPVRKSSCLVILTYRVVSNISIVVLITHHRKYRIWWVSSIYNWSIIEVWQKMRLKHIPTEWQSCTSQWVWKNCSQMGHVDNIPTMQFFTEISRNTQSISYMLSLNVSVWDFQDNALWDTHKHAPLSSKA